MPFLLEPIALDELFETDDLIQVWITDAAQNGRVYSGYSGNYYIHQKYGDVEIYSCVVVNEDNNKNILSQFDLQVTGTCIWDVRMTDIALTNNSTGDMTKLVAVKDSAGNGLAIMHLLNADVLPSYLDNDTITAQVVGFAVIINYYKDESSFADSFPECEGMKYEEFNGKKLMPAIGSVFPNGFLHNHIIREDGTTRDDKEGDDLVLVTGLVKGVYVDSVKIKEQNISYFLRVKVGTQYGDLEIIHSKSMISDEEFELLKTVVPETPEIVLNAFVVLSGDVAVNEYENGIVKDKENDLKALRYALIKGNSCRLKTILSDDVVYDSVNWDNAILGKDAVVEHLQYVHDNTRIEYYAHLATLKKGERCIVLAENEPYNLQSIVTIELNEEGMINRIIIAGISSQDVAIDETL